MNEVLNSDAPKLDPKAPRVDLTFFEQLKAAGIQMVKVPDPLKPAMLIGIGETKDVVKLICVVVNKIVKKEGLISVEIGQSLLSAVVGAQFVASEIMDISEEEVNELNDFAKANLDFDVDHKKIEMLAERIVFGALIIVQGIVDFKR